MKRYLEILEKVLHSPYSVKKTTRTGIDTISLSGVQFEHDMRNGFPLLTTKKMGIKSISAELEFFIKGLSDKKWLQDRGCHIWDEWCNPQKIKNDLNNMSKWEFGAYEKRRKELQKEESDLGRIYPVQWRDWKSSELFEKDGYHDVWDFKRFDQLKTIIERAKKNPLDRRLLVTAWRPDELDEMALPPCHYAWQILSDGKCLDLIWIQRSVDTFLGLPYNIASYGLLLILLGKELNLKPRRLIGQLGDVHIYENHIEQAKEQLKREPFDVPFLKIKDFSNIFKWEYKDIELINYVHHPKISAQIAI